MLSLVLKIKRSKNDHRKMDPEDLNFPCQELSNCGLGIALALLVHRKIGFFVCVSLIGNPAVLLGSG